jgi:hypothetical protein
MRWLFTFSNGKMSSAHGWVGQNTEPNDGGILKMEYKKGKRVKVIAQNGNLYSSRVYDAGGKLVRINLGTSGRYILFKWDSSHSNYKYDNFFIF